MLLGLDTGLADRKFVSRIFYFYSFNHFPLTPYAPPTFPNQEQLPPPLPDLINSAEHYKVKKVLDSRECKVRGKAGEPWHWVTDYFVKWKGYGPESNSWV